MESLRVNEKAGKEPDSDISTSFIQNEINQKLYCFIGSTDLGDRKLADVEAKSLKPADTEAGD